MTEKINHMTVWDGFHHPQSEEYVVVMMTRKTYDRMDKFFESIPNEPVPPGTRPQGYIYEVWGCHLGPGFESMIGSYRPEQVAKFDITKNGVIKRFRDSRGTCAIFDPVFNNNVLINTFYWAGKNLHYDMMADRTLVLPNENLTRGYRSF